MAISQDTIEQTQAATDIVSVVGEYTVLKRRSGNDWWGCCPFHNEKTASFHVDGDKKFYYCFGCHAGGDAIKFIMEMEKASYSDAVTTLAKRAGIEVRYTTGDGGKKEKEENDNKEKYIDLYERTSRLFNYLLTQSEAGKAALEYIKGRGITDKTIAAFRLGYAPKDRRWLKGFLKKKNYSDEFLLSSGLFSKNYTDIAFFSDRLMFPIMDRLGKCVAFGGRLLSGEGPKYLNSGDMAQYKKGNTLYAFNQAKKTIREEKRVIFCEGYMDCIAYHQCGVTYATAPLGTALTEDQIKMVKSFVDTVILSFDSDDAGITATKRAILMCRKMSLICRVIVLEGGKDPAEIMLKLGADVLTKYADNAILDADFLLYRLGGEYAIDTMDGKTLSCLAFFDYIDALSSTVLKESCIEKLSRFLSLSYEAVRRDYENRDEAKRRVQSRKMAGNTAKTVIKSGELRAVLAAVANLEYSSILTDALEEKDFLDDAARAVFCVLKKRSGGTLGQLLSDLAKEEESGQVPKGTQAVVLDSVSSAEYTTGDVKQLVKDGVERIKRNALRRMGAALTKTIESLQGNDEGASHFLADKAKISNALHNEKGAL